MLWLRLLTAAGRAFDRHWALRLEYLFSENRILRSKLPRRVSLTNAERRRLGRLGAQLGRRVLANLASIAKPETILRWQRRLVERREPIRRRRPGRPRTEAEIEDLVVRLAKENRLKGYKGLVGMLANLGISLSTSTIGRILKRHGIAPAPERRKTMTWREFLAAHWHLLAATDFFTATVWTLRGPVTYYVLVVMKVATRTVEIAGITPNPHDAWMAQVARNLTMESWGFLDGTWMLLHDRDGKFTAHFRALLKGAGARTLALPKRSPNLNAFLERWVRSVKEECLSRLVILGETSLRRALAEYVEHFYHERNHQGLDNKIPEPRAGDRIGASDGRIERRRRLGGLLSFYYRRAG
jgi:transposase InsO family protein